MTRHRVSLPLQRLSRTKLDLVPAEPTYFADIYRWSVSPSVSRTWMYRGAVPSFESFVEHLFANVLAQFVALRDGQPAAVGAIYDANFGSERASIRLLVSPDDRHVSTAVDAFHLIAAYAFDTFPISRLIMETNSVAVDQFRSAVDRGYFVEEARLHRHERHGSEWSDLIFLSINREVVLPRAHEVIEIRLPDVQRN